MLRKKGRFGIRGKRIPHSKVYHYDVIILGGGPAGLTAAIYSSRYGMRTGLITRSFGGTANLAKQIENYPGYNGSGYELMQKFYKQAHEFGAEFLNDDIAEIEKDSNGFIVYTSTHKLVHSKSLIIALGTDRRKLNIKGEDNFLGKGVSYCATCDASFFKNKQVAVIGGSDSACIDALILSGFADLVYLIYRGEKLRCEEITRRKLGEKKNVIFIYNTVAEEIKGKEFVSGIVIKKYGKKKELKVDGVFIDAGCLPVSDIAKVLGINMDKEGYIIADHEMKTNVKGIFAAGDIVKSKLKQIVIAASQGAMAAKSCHEYVEGLR